MSAATSSRSCATWSRSRSRRRASASARTCRRAPQLAAEERVLDALVGAGREPGHQGFVPPQAARRRAQRQGDRDRGAAVRRRHADVRDSRHAGRADGRDLDRRHLRQARRRPHQDAARHGGGIARDPDQRGIRQAARQRPAGAGSDQGGRAERHRVPRRDRQDRRRARAAPAPTSRARACSATCCR